mmetsp:Transcript_13457/g.20987  ORF Transcript_13457/g.20987 Transcript_13457/m.20987 type:complete len:263 (+) Transcript_13457:182-970(+)|eukprot:CAMPEP_0195307064 /NCGR_PEP_ID=MMETSP0707-20130614/37526_1 /TAXON_ID=33640 /ORGANISM="Asterionellopsis glacialis, Strain CCMP134" /LENGTH=262 /DNA_ID=CAMNT_0040371305 /DNA_START=149 /DNA_END=937 /DNA_ORIENTATION=-
MTSSTCTTSDDGETSTPSSPETVVSLELKLCPSTHLTVSLYHVKARAFSDSTNDHHHNQKVNLPNELCRITTHLRSSDTPHKDDTSWNDFAIMDARRIISLHQLVIAANMAFVPRSSKHNGGGGRPPPQETRADIWKVVLNAAGSTHFGHVLRDYAFGEQTMSLSDSTTTHNTTNMIPVVALSIGTTTSQHTSAFTNLFSSNNNSNNNNATIQCTLQPLSALQDTSASPELFLKWYKLTPTEIKATSLEKAVLTKIATKFYI